MKLVSNNKSVTLYTPVIILFSLGKFCSLQQSILLSLCQSHDCSTVLIYVAVDRFYTALFSALEQTHCARM